MSRTLIDVDDDALSLAMAHYGTDVKRDAVNRALREVAERRRLETDDLDDWIVGVGSRLADTDWSSAWRK